ncbi:hypothetical protein EV191_103143 [Tamaricihabitans halophyticus]|uniref:Uncharacterized protein n=1 Tax=Tamaricihabitans halophyticus TaxID=1262583 RepID=A0A4R2QVK6_9PSEU|nr:zf-HC2 domain-containing protein [Tamaricihabitans halophyticus]TCP54102.1 hypothetical protein EV191_103143 [Tamaricihabitans halophyticus]
MTEHISATLLRRYAQGAAPIETDTLWTVEAHLESCANCRATLASQYAGSAELLDGVWDRLNSEIARSVPAPRRRLRFRLAPPALLPWFAMSALVIGMALAADLTAPAALGSSPLVVLLAPFLPVLGVALSWSRGLDPAHEVVVGTPMAGLRLVFRRTLAVLLLCLPLVTLAGWLAAGTPVLALLPALAFTIGTLALGSVLGVQRAALALGLGWLALVVLPSIALGEVLLVLQPASAIGWLLAVLGCGAVLLARPNSFTQLASQR